MDFLALLYAQMDRILMPFYRFPDNPVAGYYLGTFILALGCVITGKYSASLAFRLNKGKITRDTHETEHFHALSIEALKAGDKAAYTACNSIANEACGNAFFSQVALSASYLWPVFIALGWMQYRFGEVDSGLPFSIPLAGDTAGYAVTFILCYIFARILYGKMTA
ncbi:MAG: hypothetical protein GXP46_05990 [Deferribacteres bacterium]|nr:hypothetical protein [Deferribacteres bacterium]